MEDKKGAQIRRPWKWKARMPNMKLAQRMTQVRRSLEIGLRNFATLAKLERGCENVKTWRVAKFLQTLQKYLGGLQKILNLTKMLGFF